MKEKIITFIQFLKEFTTSIVKQFFDNNGLVLTGALSFFMLISVIPLSTLFISLFQWFLPPDYINVIIEIVEKLIPGKMKSELQTSLQIISTLDIGFNLSRLIHSLISIGFLIWLGSFIFDIIERSLCVTFHVAVHRKFWKSFLTHVIEMFTIGFLFFFLSLISFGGNFFIAFLEKSYPSIYTILFQYTGLIWILPFLFNVIIGTSLFFFIYKISTPKKLRKRSYIKGALFAAIAWAIMRNVFGIYIEKVNDFSLFFGTLAIIARIAIWTFYSSVIFILGAEVVWFSEERFYTKKKSNEKLL